MTSKGTRRGDQNWKSRLILSASDKPKAILANALLALREAPQLQNRLRFNEMSLDTEVCAPLPWDNGNHISTARAWTDNDDRLLAEWLQRNDINIKIADAAAAAETVGRESRFHPVKGYLEALQWDGVSRAEQWLNRYMGASENQYTRTVGEKWLISAVARLYKPGCKVDTVLVLEGNQGHGKSTALAILGGSWFTDRLSDVRTKDAAAELSGVWIVEMAELDALAKADASAIKAFLSRDTDRYRPTYGRRTISVPRQCVFAATVNPEGGYLKDPTGARRFWPVMCGQIDLEALRADRDQLWAEALVAYQSGENWWLTREQELLAAAEQSGRYQSDPWATAIETFVADRNQTSISAVLAHLGILTDRQTQSHQVRVSKCLVSLGFIRVRANEDGDRFYVYRRLMPLSPSGPSVTQ